MSSRTLSEAEVSLLKNVLTFVGTPARVTVRRSVNTIQAQPPTPLPTPNITKEQQQALISLKDNHSSMVLLTGKGRASIILNADK